MRSGCHLLLVHLTLDLQKKSHFKLPVRQLRATLESEFNCDLGSHKVLLRKTVDAFLAEKQPKEEEEEEEEEAEEAEEAASSSSSSSEEEEPAPKKAKASAAKGKGKGGGGFQKPLKLSSEMAAFTREEKLSRAQIVRKCWVSLLFFFSSLFFSFFAFRRFSCALYSVSLSPLSAASLTPEKKHLTKKTPKQEYIKAENLQDPADKRKILVKGKLETIFTPPITMFSMNKQISKHVFPDED